MKKLKTQQDELLCELDSQYITTSPHTEGQKQWQLFCNIREEKDKKCKLCVMILLLFSVFQFSSESVALMWNRNYDTETEKITLQS